MKKVIFVLSLVGQLGFIIALPAALFGYGGAQLDKYLNTSPIFTLLGFAVAISGSGYWVYRFIKRLE